MTSSQSPLDTQKLEAWLRQLESALHDVSVIDRSDIIMEMNSHIRDSYDRGGRTLDEILTSLGEPIQVANRYRLERGMQTVVIPKTTSATGSFFKWATLSILGLAAIVLLSGVFLVSKFLPLVQVDENEKRVKILGGMIDIADDKLAREVSEELGNDFQIKLGGRSREGTAQQRLKGELRGPFQKIAYHAANSELEVESHEGETLEYRCKVDSTMTPEKLIQTTGTQEAKFDFTGSSHARCRLMIPRKSSVAIEISNGDVKLKEMRNPVSAKIDNGRIEFSKDATAFYRLKAEVTNGLVVGLADFEEEQSARAQKSEAAAMTADLTVVNGGIRVR